MFINLIYRLRELGVPVGTAEALDLARALRSGLHDSSLTGFYYTARSLLIHHEGHLDAFDVAFLAEFKGVETAELKLTDELRQWLEAAAQRRARTDADQLARLDAKEIEELRRLFAERMAEQTERHDGGNYWIGTGGSSPFGQGGSAQSGLSTGSSGGGRSAVHVADARNYRPYRSDITLDIRQMEVALRRLRAFVREGADVELDIERTIDETAKNVGEIEIVTRSPSRPNTHVILMIDVGGSMFPYSELMSQMFSAAKKATHFKELRTYYFHNCVYGMVYETDRFTDPVWVHDLMRECDGDHKLIMVGDALMAPYELGQRGLLSATDRGTASGFEWLNILRQHYPHNVWLNPEPQARWAGTTIQDIGGVFEMFPLTVDGLTDAMAHLNRGVSRRR